MSGMKKTEYFAKAGDGTDLRYVIWSGGDGGSSTGSRRLALVHSLAMVAEFWQATADALGAALMCLLLTAVDMGHRRSLKALTVLSYSPMTSPLFLITLTGIRRLSVGRRWVVVLH
jgi:hypothetical protein